MTATLAPRMNVDNGFKIFRYNGQGPVVNVPLEQAFDAVWRPAAAGVYPNRGPSPKRNRPGEEGAAAAPAPAPAAKPAAYRPPGSSGALAEMLRREKAPAGKVC
jgi:translation initiation factor 2A